MSTSKLPSSESNFAVNLKLHWVVFLFGFTAILGQLISIHSFYLVFYRLVITVASLGIWLYFFKGMSFRITKSQLLRLALVGLVVTLHWICFYTAIKVSNVSVTLSSFATLTLFTAFIEPIFYRRRPSWVEVVIGLVVLIGIVLIFSLETRYQLGVILGVLAGLTSSIFNVYNGRFAQEMETPLITFYELSFGVLFMAGYFVGKGDMEVFRFDISRNDWIWLLLLSIVCTTYAFTAITNILKKLKPFSVMMAFNLEPVYGILLSWIFFGEYKYLGPGFFWGTGLILSCLFLYPVLKRKFA